MDKPQKTNETLQDLLDMAMKKFFEVKNIIRETLDSQPDTADPVQHNKWLTQAMQEIERIIQ